MEATVKIETVTCSRCGGSGQYSYCQMYGSTCFKCAGAKRVYTKRGAVAKAFYEAQLSKRADQIQPGDKIRENGPFFNGWVTVQAVTPYDGSGNVSTVNGVVIPQRTDLLAIETNKITHLGAAPETVYRVAATKEQKMEAMQKAVEFQSSLTKQGKPRKQQSK